MSTQANQWQKVPGETSDAPYAPGTHGRGASAVNTVRGLQSLASVWRLMLTACLPMWAGVKARRTAHARRSLRVVETVGMGEKRFVAIVEAQHARFLIGGGSAGISLLACLEPDTAAEPDFAAALDAAGAGSPEKLRKAMLDLRKEAW